MILGLGPRGAQRTFNVSNLVVGGLSWWAGKAARRVVVDVLSLVAGLALGEVAVGYEPSGTPVAVVRTSSGLDPVYA